MVEVFVNEKLKTKQYHNQNEAKKDIMNVFQAFPDLHLKEDTYIYTDRTTAHLLSLYGTIPVVYKGVTYNIPIQIWLLTGHPYTAPYVYVKPTNSMVVKPSKHVDQAGRVYTPYLTEWRAPRSNTCDLINMLCMIFARDCPVYAKPVNPPARPPNPRLQYPVYPPGPGYPTSQTAMPMTGMPTPHGGHHVSQSPYGGVMPVHHSSSMPTHAGYNQQQRYTSPSNTSMPSYSTTQQTPYPATSSYQPHPVNERLAGKAPTRQGSVIAEEHIRASLLSTAEDKLKCRVKEVFQMGKIELESLEQTKQELERGNRELQEMATKMKDEEANLKSNISLLKQKNNEVEEVAKKLEKDSDNMNIDEAVVTTAPLYNQILNLFAEENAVEDTIYYLSDALRREVIELEVFLKTVRSLSRRQFMLRATLQKARSTAGLSSNLVGI